eukprot:tig00021046_g17790.t1
MASAETAINFWGISLGSPEAVLGIAATPADRSGREVEAAYRQTLQRLEACAEALRDGGERLGSPRQHQEWFTTLRHVVALAYRALLTPAVVKELEQPLAPPEARLVALIGGMGVEIRGAVCDSCLAEPHAERPRRAFPEAAYAQWCEAHKLAFATIKELDPKAIRHLCVPPTPGGRLRTARVPPPAQDPPPGAAPAASDPGPSPTPVDAAALLVSLAAPAPPAPEHPSPASSRSDSPPVAPPRSPASRCAPLRLKGDRPAALCRRGPRAAAAAAARGEPRKRTAARAASAAAGAGSKRPRAEGDGPELAAPSKPSPRRLCGRGAQDAGALGPADLDAFWTSISEHDVIDLPVAAAAWSAPDFFMGGATQQREFLRRHLPRANELADLALMGFQGLTAIIVLAARRLGFPAIDAAKQRRGSNWLETARSNKDLLQILEKAIASINQEVPQGAPPPAALPCGGFWRVPAALLGLAERSFAERRANAELRARWCYGFESFGPVRWRGETIFLPRGLVPEGMSGPPERMAELLGAKLGLEPRPVDLLALRAIEAAFFERRHGPPRVAEVASWAMVPERRVTLNCHAPGGGEVDERFIREHKRAKGKLGPFVKPLPPGCSAADEALHDYVLDRASQACVSLCGEVVAVHMPGLFQQGQGIERVAAAVACGSVALPFAERASIRNNKAMDQLLLEAAREAADAALRTGRLDVMQAKLESLEGYLHARSGSGPQAAAEPGGKKKVRSRRIATGFQRSQGATIPKPVRLNLQLGADPHENRRLHLFNHYLSGVLEYLFSALCVVNLGAACSMAEVALNLFERQPYSYGFWTLHWMNGPDRITPAHRDCNDARESYAALVYFHRDGDRNGRLHRLRFPTLGIALDLRHGDVVFIRGNILEHEVLEDDDTDGRYCMVFTLGNNLKVDAKPKAS